MGKNLRQQRRGKGTPRYRTPSHRYPGGIKYPSSMTEGKVTDIINAPGRSAPVAVIKSNKHKFLNIAHEGMEIGQKVSDDANPGSISRLEKIPEGSKIFNIELHPGDGGRLCRSSGAFATIIAHEKGKSIVLLSSKEKKVLPSNCRATVGSVASDGRTEKPIRKAGTKFIVMKSLGKYYPRVSGVAMNPVDHPFGGSAKPGKHKTVSRGMPPGKKVGSISPKRMGKLKRK